MVYLILQTGRELNLVIKWGGGKLWFFVPLDPRGLFDCRGGKCGFFFFCLCQQHNSHLLLLSVVIIKSSLVWSHSIVKARTLSSNKCKKNNEFDINR